MAEISNIFSAVISLPLPLPKESSGSCVIFKIDCEYWGLTVFPTLRNNDDPLEVLRSGLGISGKGEVPRNTASTTSTINTNNCSYCHCCCCCYCYYRLLSLDYLPITVASVLHVLPFPSKYG